jgi:hypothetical protein
LKKAGVGGGQRCFLITLPVSSLLKSHGERISDEEAFRRQGHDVLHVEINSRALRNLTDAKQHDGFLADDLTDAIKLQATWIPGVKRKTLQWRLLQVLY